MSARSLIKTINQNLYDFDRVLNGFLTDMSFFDFRAHLLELIAEISDRKNTTRANINALGEYYNMSSTLDVEYEKWDMENNEALPEDTYNKISSMYVDIHNTCNDEVIRFLMVYDKENIEVINFDEEEYVSIKPHLDSIENNTKSIYKIFKESVSLKPGVFGISIDIKKLFSN
ncbi:MAG: hypothetical protein K9L79_05965 [Methylobacter tundripaludum]|nr:hypothetical protein [Methylobacter tundripaludum]